MPDSKNQFNVLIVDDSPTMRQMITFAIKRVKGLSLTEAHDGVDAFKKLGEQQFDLIITDIIMPVMDGLKLIGLVRSRPELKEIPIIVISTRGAEEDLNRARALGANSYILKPIQAHNVMNEVKKTLDIS